MLSAVATACNSIRKTWAKKRKKEEGGSKKRGREKYEKEERNGGGGQRKRRRSKKKSHGERVREAYDLKKRGKWGMSEAGHQERLKSSKSSFYNFAQRDGILARLINSKTIHDVFIIFHDAILFYKIFFSR